jgi:ATP-dependent DNA helicase 2 subunit 2
MATTPSKEAIVLIIDAGPSMVEAREQDGGARSDGTEPRKLTTRFHDAMRAAAMLIQRKLLFPQSGDRLGIVLFGTKETKNELADEAGAYGNIFVVHDLEAPSVELLRQVSDGGSITPEVGGAKGDLLDALVVAMDMIVKRIGKKRYQKRVFMITDAETATSKSHLGTIVERFV